MAKKKVKGQAAQPITKATCRHDRPKAVCKIGRCTLWAGNSKSYLNATVDYDLIIDLAGKVTPFNVTGIPKWLARFTKAAAIEVYRLPWADMQPPSLTLKQWRGLVADLGQGKRSHRSRRDINVLIQCEAGHGRTGTALACLAAASGCTEHPIDFVRRLYCSEAVETDGQCWYVADMFQVEDREGSQKSVQTTAPTGYMSGGKFLPYATAPLVKSTNGIDPTKLIQKQVASFDAKKRTCCDSWSDLAHKPDCTVTAPIGSLVRTCKSCQVEITHNYSDRLCDACYNSDKADIPPMQ
jgi:hypothetical protein